MSSDYSHIHLGRDEMIRFHHHLMDEKEMQIVEKHLAGCELCTEALKGVAEMEDAMKLYSIHRDLQHRAKRKNLSQRKVFSQLELITIMAVILLIAFIVLIVFLFFLK